MSGGGSLNFSLVLAVVDKATAGLRAVAGSMEKVGKAGAALKEAGASMRIARENVDDFTGRMKAGLQAVLAPAAEVETALARLAADQGIDRTSDTIKRMQASALAWSGAHTQSATEYVATASAMLKVTKDEAAAMKATEAALRVSTATSKDAGAIAATLGVIYAQVGDKTKDAGQEFDRLGDTLTRAQQVFRGIDVSALADPLKDALPAAKASKVSIEQVVTVLGHLNAAGIQGGEAGAGFAAVLENLSTASTKLGFAVAKTADGGVDLIGSLKNVEAKFGSLKDMTPETARKIQEAFGPAAFKAIAATVGQTGELGKSFGQVTNAAGAASRAQASMESTTAAQAQIAQQQLDALKVELAAGIGPAIQGMIPLVKDSLGWFSGFAKENPKLVGMAGTLAVVATAAGSVLGPILSIGGAVASVGGMMLSAAASAATWAFTQISALVPSLIAGASSAWAFAAAMLANPITWIVLAIVALAAVLYIYWEPISAFFVKLWAGIKEAFAGAWQSILGLWGRVTAFFTGIWDTVKQAFSGGIGGIVGLLISFSPVALLAKAFNAVSEWLFGYSLFDAGKNIVNTVVEGIKAMADQPFESMKAVVQKVRNLLPFSPAKDGPLRDLHKVKLVETVADAVRPAPLVDAMSGAAGQAMAAMTDIPTPRFASSPSSPAIAASAAAMRGGAAAPGTAPVINLTIQLGTSDRSAAAELEAWVRNPQNAALLASAVQQHAERTDRTRFDK